MKSCAYDSGKLGHGGKFKVLFASSKTPLVGWEAVRKSWAEGTFARFSELSVSMINPDVRIIGNTAVAVGIEIVKGKRADNGAAVAVRSIDNRCLREARRALVYGPPSCKSLAAMI